MAADIIIGFSAAFWLIMSGMAVERDDNKQVWIFMALGVVCLVVLAQ